MSLAVILFTYLYNPSDWQHYPRLDEIRNFTADAFNTVYVVAENAIVELDERSNLPREVFTSANGLPDRIALAAYDADLARFWVVSKQGELYVFLPSGGTARRIFLASTSPVRRLGVGAEHVFLDSGYSMRAVHKRSEQMVSAEPDSAVVWVSSAAQTDMKSRYPYLAPWVMVDERMRQLPYSQVFTHRAKVYVAVSGYGYLVFDEPSWRELLRYQSPRAAGVHSLFALDSSLYAFGTNGVDQFVPGQGKVIHHPFDRWATTTNQTPAWSQGLMDRLRRNRYVGVKLVGENLFLLENHEAEVVNIPKKVVSQITLESWLYDVDFHLDSLFVATDDGVFLTIIPRGEPKQLRDERSKLYETDVLAIVRGRHARYFWTGSMVVKQTRRGWEYFTAPGFMPVPQNAVSGRDSLIVLGGKGGLTIYNPETYFQLSLTTDEGLLSNKVTAVLVSGEHLWIATDAGLQRFDLGAVLPK